MAFPDSYIERIRANDSSSLVIPIAPDFRRNDQVVAFAQAINGNDSITYCDIRIAGPIASLDWEPLLHELRTRECLQHVRIWDSGNHLQGNISFRNQLFREVQQNAEMQQLDLRKIQFSNDNHLWIVPIFGRSPSLKCVFLVFCRTDAHGGEAVARALAENKNIEKAGFQGCNASLLCPLLEKMTFYRGLSSIKHITYGPDHSRTLLPPTVPAEHASICKSMRQYLESPAASVQVFRLEYIKFQDRHSENDLAIGLRRNTSVREIIFSNCTKEDVGGEILAGSIIKENAHLECLRIFDGNGALLNGKIWDRFREHSFAGAIATNLALPRRRSSLRCLEIVGDIEAYSFGELADALRVNYVLEHLIMFDFNEFTYWELLNQLRHFHFKELSISLPSWCHGSYTKIETVADALKSNFNIRTINITPAHLLEEEEADEEDEAAVSEEEEKKRIKKRIEFFLNRNRELAKWNEKPSFVPPCVCPHVVKMSEKAGWNSLYKTLLSLSGQHNGLRHQGGKRKHSEC